MPVWPADIVMTRGPHLTGRVRVALLVLLLLGVVVVVAPAHAGVSPFWRELGGSASGGGVSQATAPKAIFDTSVAVDADGKPVVAYAEIPNATDTQGPIVVKRWNGTAFVPLSTIPGPGYSAQVRISPSGTIYVAWLHDDVDGNSEIHLRMFDGTSFVELGASDSPGGITGSNAGIGVPFSLAIGVDGQPVVAFVANAQSGVVDVTSTPAVVQDTPQIYVRRWTGAAWEFIGGGFDGGGASAAVSFDSATAGAVLHGADEPTLAIDSSGAPVVAFVYLTQFADAVGSNTDIYVTRWNGTAWQAVGPSLPLVDDAAGRGGPGGVSTSDTASLKPSIAAAPDGSLALAWEETSPDDTALYVWVRVWNGSTWAELDGSATDGGISEPFTSNGVPQTAVGPDNRPTVAWTALTPGSPAAQIFVKHWNGSAWVEPAFHSATDAGISDAALEAFAPALALTPSGGSAPAGVPTVAWVDARPPAESAQVFLRQLFSGASFALAVDVRGAGAVSSDPIGIECASGLCTTVFPSGILVNLIATPDGPARFYGWKGACSGTAGCTVTMDQAQSVNASFGGLVRLSVAVPGGGGRIVSNVGGLNCRDACSVDLTSGTAVTLTATPDAGGAFAGWGGACSGIASCVLTLSANKTVTAAFKSFRVRVAVAVPTGAVAQGAVGAVVGGNLNCGIDNAPTCFDDLLGGTRVAFQAAPQPGNRFLNWSTGPCAGRTNATCEFVVAANTTSTALFRGVTGVRVLKAGNGGGTVSGPGISCGVDCFQEIFSGTSVTLTPAATTGTTFRGWSGDACNGQAAGGCTFVVAGNRSATVTNQSITATFQLNRHTLNVTPRASGNVATVDALPDPINCGSGGGKCSATLDFGTLVRLQATPIPGSKFIGWTGCTAVSGANCSFTMTANRTVAPAYRDVTGVSLTKTGMGTVTSTPAGIACGTTCTSAAFEFTRNTLVKLTPVPVVGWDFVGWSGDPVCPGTGPCSFNASTLSVAAAATFTVQLKTLRVTVLGSGSVTGPGFSCDGASTPCAQLFPYGTVETLTPVPAPGFRFTGWSQDCAGTGVCKPTMTTNHSVTATFKQVFGVTVTRQGNAVPLGTITATGINCGLDCAEDYLSNTVVTFSRGAPPVGRIFRWLGDCAFRGANASCTLTINANKSVIADYSLQQLGLTVNVTGPGSVTGLTGGPCASSGGNANCLSIVNYGTPVLLQAVPRPASPQGEFVKWAGCTTTAGANCSVPMTSNRTVVVTFQPIVTALSVQAPDSAVPLVRGGRRQYSAIATFSDGSTQDVSSRSTWTSANASVATVVSTTGLVTGAGFGTTSVTAVFRTSLTGSMAQDSIDVSADTLAVVNGLTVDCSPYGTDGGPLSCLPSNVGFEVECRAFATLAHGGAPQDVTEQAAWSSGNAASAKFLGLSNFGGPVVASFRILTGATFVRATIGSVLSSSNASPVNRWVVQSTPLTVSNVSVAPASLGFTTPTRARLVATAQFNNVAGGVAGCPLVPPARDFSALTGWSTVPEPSPVADVDFFGVVTPLASGATSVQWGYPRGAAAPPFQGSIPITVTLP